MTDPWTVYAESWTPDDWHEAAKERAAIAEHEGGESADRAYYASQDWMMRRLAKWLMDTHSLAERREFLSRWEKRHGVDSLERVKGYLKTEVERRRHDRNPDSQ